MTVTTVRDIITDAGERAGLIADGGFSLRPSEANRALRVLQRLVLNLPGANWWIEVDTDEDYTAGENERIRVTVDSPVSVTVPDTFASSNRVLWCCNQITLACSDYENRAPKDGARVHLSDLYSDGKATFFYRGDIAQWTRADELTLDSECPLSAEFDEGLAAMLAVRLGVVNPVTLAMAQAAEAKMRARFGKRQAVAAELALVRTSSNREYIN